MIGIMLSHLQRLAHSIRTFRKGQYLFHQADMIKTMFWLKQARSGWCADIGMVGQ